MAPPERDIAVLFLKSLLIISILERMPLTLIAAASLLATLL